MINDQERTREWIDFLIAIAAWGLSAYVIITLLRIALIPYISM